MPSNIETPAWSLPPDLAVIVEEDGEWEDPSWDPILLTVIGQTRHKGRVIPIAWQLSLWPADVFFKTLNSIAVAKVGKADGHTWSDLIHADIAERNPSLSAKLHDDSDASTCVIWVESETDGRVLIETVWTYLHDLQRAHDGLP